jgi:hypothetical protein
LWQLGVYGYKGLALEDMVRSSLWKEEDWDAQPYASGMIDPADITYGLTQPIPGMDHFANAGDFTADETLRNNTTPHMLLEPLEHYGKVPGAATIPICRSWNGFAISSVNIHESQNAPCICDDFLSRSFSWEHPAEGATRGTDRFVKNMKLYDNEEWGKVCRLHHKCEEESTWRERLDLAPDESSKVLHAWTRCKKTHDHNKIGIQKE